MPSFFRSVRGTGVVPPSEAWSSSGAQLWEQPARGEQEGPCSSPPAPPPATAPHSQAILLDQPFGEEFFHTFIHSGTEPISFLRQRWGHLGDITQSGVRAECSCEFLPPPVSNVCSGQLQALGAGMTLGGCSHTSSLPVQLVDRCTDFTYLTQSWPWTHARPHLLLSQEVSCTF